MKKQFGWIRVKDQDKIDLNFYDSYGTKIKVGDTLVYERKKKGRWHPPAGLVRVQVDEMIVRVAARFGGDYLEMIKGINVIQIEPELRYPTRYRIYNTIKTTKVLTP